jgi:hypothetical protein
MMSTQRLHALAAPSAGCTSALGILVRTARSGRSHRDVAPERWSSSAVTFTPGGNGKNGLSTRRKTLSISTS